MDTASAQLNERPSPLLSVPTEIIEMIARFADDEYPEERPLFKPRLNCRQLRDQLDPEFAQRYLSEPFIAMFRSSLEALIYICQHPIFGPKVRKVRLLAHADLDRVAETLAKKAGYGLLEADKLPTAHQPPEERVKEAVENFTGENLHLRTSDEATKLLRTAFNVLSEYARPLGNCSALVGFGDQATNAFREALDRTDRRYPACGTILQNLLRMADKSGCEVQGIEMNGFGSMSLQMSHLTRIPPDLLSMPNEILTEICTHAHDGVDTKSRGKEWLRAVRLTCKQLHVPATVEFGKRFFASVPVMAARISLETLLDICKHPLIGPQVSVIQFYGRRFCATMVPDLDIGLGDHVDNRDLRGARNTIRRMNSALEFVEEELEIEQYQGAFKYLVSALQMIQGYRNSVTFAVSTDASIKPFGHLQVIELFSGGTKATLDDVIDHDCIRSSLHVLLVAAARSNCHVERLEITTDEHTDHSERHSRTSDPVVEKSVAKLQSRVKVVHIDLSRDKATIELRDVVSIVLERMENLVELHIRTADDSNSTYRDRLMPDFNRMLKSIASRCLRIIKLEDTLCSQKAMLFLLKRNRDTLRELNLSNVLLQGSWEEIMIRVRDHCSLNFLGASRLVELDENFNDTEEEYWVDEDGFGKRDETGDLSSLDKSDEED
ncbi:hypothetical protein KCU77_g1150, partial [Aureobasidium melanogenum]